MSNRVIRPIGPVTKTLQAAGYRQYAAIFVDNKQVRGAAILSLLDGGKVKFVGHYVDANGEIHKTHKYVDNRRAADKLMQLVEAHKDTPVANPARAALNRATSGKVALSQAEAVTNQPAKTTRQAAAAKRRAPRRKQRVADDEAVLIDCKACGFVHRDDVMCP